MGMGGEAKGFKEKPNGKPLEFCISRGALVVTVVSSILVAFTAGCMARPFLNQRLVNHQQQPLGKGKVTGPISVYTFHHFVAKDVCTEEETEDTSNETSEKCIASTGGTTATSSASTADTEDNVSTISGSGQHLVVDMEGLDSSFLNSDEQLSDAIVETSRRTRLPLRSYHCHALIPMGVSCVGIFSTGHVAFHTWPEEGVITLDLYAWSQSNAFRNYLSTIQELFGISNNQEPTVVWSHKRRGFQLEEGGDPDFALKVAEPGLDMKQQIASVQTRFQRIDIVDTIDRQSPVELPHYKKTLAATDSFYATHTFQPNRRVFLDGHLQSTRHGDAAYHEALVHPAMFAHDFPERVAIIGGGEGATLREVLKHATVKQAIMVEIDEMMIDVSRKYLREWSSCDNLVGSTESCFDEPRASVYTEDALAWFIDRFYAQDGQEVNAKGLENAEPMDVIIMDALDPEDSVEFCDALYGNAIFMNALFNALSEEGVLVMQLGEAPLSGDPAESVSRHHHRKALTEDLAKVGFETIHIYEEGHCLFGAPWSYLVAFKDWENRVNWYANEAEIELQMHKRAMRTKSGESPFLHFDGATMLSYQNPHKAFETVFCREEAPPESCRQMSGLDPNKNNAPLSSFEVKKSEVGDNAGRGLFAKVDVDADTYIGMEKGVESVYCPPWSLALLNEFQKHKEANPLVVFDAYLHGYGFETASKGAPEIYVDSSTATFVNHGCNGTRNLGWWRAKYLPSFTEWTVDPKEFPRELCDFAGEEYFVFDPVIARNLRLNDGALLVSLRKIGAGEELLDNYLFMIENRDEWEEYVMDLRAQCAGEGVGQVTQYEDNSCD